MRGKLFIIVVLAFALPCVVFAQRPVANFTSNITSGCSPVVVSFVDISSNNPTSWRWDLGNGVTSTNRDPQATYFNPGTYTVTLTATNASGSATVTKTSYLTVHALPDVDFASPDTLGCVPLNARFTDLSKANSGTIRKWEWNFGDGATSTATNPTHLYAATGAYGVTLKVTNSLGCTKNAVKNLYIKVGEKVKADFLADVPAFCNVPVKVDFLNASATSGNMSYSWKFGDGGTSSAASTAHTYNTYGTFAAKLNILSDGGCKDSITKNIVITKRLISIAGPDSLCSGFSGSFTAVTQPTANTYEWQMGDGTTYNSSSVSHVYSNAGTYTVRLITTYNNCSDTVAKTVRVNPSPVVNFTANVTQSCKVPFVVTFQNATTNALTYLWDFGDGTTSTLRNPTKTYTTFGTYAVSLSTTSNRGCIKGITKVDFIDVQPSNVVIANLPATGCLPYTFTPDVIVNRGGQITSYSWDFGDGSTSNLAVPNHTYTLPGTYSIKLKYTTVAGCTDSLLMPNALTLGNTVAVDFSVDPMMVCGKQNVLFKSLVQSTVNSFEWSFGDGSSAISADAEHRYSDTGFYTISLSVDSNGCRSTNIKTDLIYVGGTIAKFEFLKDCINRGQVSFKNTSLLGSTYLWDFGDGTTSTDSDPVHVYTSDGDYKVLLVSSNNGCNDSITLNVPVWLGKTDITAVADTICKGDVAQLTLIHPRPEFINNIKWDYGNGATSESSSNPIAQLFSQTGVFTLTAISNDIFGCIDTVTKTNFIRVNGPLADFGAPVVKGCKNAEITFDDLSTTDGLNALAKWEWSFGDGSVEGFLAPPFKHIYAGEGYFDVTLKVTDSSGCSSTVTKSQFVFISQAAANFVSLDSMTCQNSQASFRDISFGGVVSYTWDFGDGSTSTLPDPTHAYADTGLYTVKLFVTATSGCVDSLVKTNYVTVKNPKAKFGISDLTISCAPLQVNFYDSSYYAKSYLWEFSDGKTSTFPNPSYSFFTPGNQLVKLTVTSFGGCQSTFSSNLDVTGPVGTLNYSPLIACENSNLITYNAASKNTKEFKWDFNDGTIVTGSDSVITHTYKTRGKYVPKVIFTDVSGCTLAVDGTDTIFIEGATAKFSIDTNVICENGVIQFSDSSFANTDLTYKWEFGDGSFSTLQTPLPHRYANAGNYKANLIVTTSNSCSDTVSIDNIKAVKYPVPSIVSDAEGCEPATVSFTAQLAADTSQIVAWLWEFGNGQIVSLKNPPAQLFATAGSYVNSLTVVNSSGCSSQTFDSLTVYPIPKILLNDTTICRGDSLQLLASGANQYTWSPSANLSCINCSNPIASPQTDQVFRVNVSSSYRCPAEDSITIKVLQPFAVSVVQPIDSICIGTTAQLQANGAQNYLWTPSGSLNFNNIANPKAQPGVNTLYTVVGYDTLGCFRDTATAEIIVYPYPTVEAGPDITLAAGNTKTIVPVYGGQISKYLWMPSKDLNCTDCPNATVSARDNITYTIRATNDAGCSTEDFFRVIVTCDNSAVFIPNTFSPNGDGMNDVFYPRGNGIDRISYMTIVNRTGEVVYNRKDISPDVSSAWDGKHKGKNAGMGVYTYVIEIICKNSTVLKFTGNITLIQ